MDNYEVFVRGGPAIKTTKFKLPRAMLVEFFVVFVNISRIDQKKLQKIVFFMKNQLFKVKLTLKSKLRGSLRHPQPSPIPPGLVYAQYTNVKFSLCKYA